MLLSVKPYVCSARDLWMKVVKIDSCDNTDLLFFYLFIIGVQCVILLPGISTVFGLYDSFLNKMVFSLTHEDNYWTE
jgi:hypothetical protein